jgi:hypothetical protein
MACRLVLSAAPSRWWVVVCVLLPGFFWRTNCWRPCGSDGAGALDFVSGSSPGLQFTGCASCFLRLPPGGDLQFVALRIACVKRFLSASMTLHSIEMCEYWVCFLSLFAMFVFPFCQEMFFIVVRHFIVILLSSKHINCKHVTFCVHVPHITNGM